MILETSVCSQFSHLTRCWTENVILNSLAFEVVFQITNSFNVAMELRSF